MPLNRNFPTPGLTFFWFLNDECRDEHIDAQIREFAQAGVANVVLHPRAGLLLPYGGDDWFAFIKRTVLKCVEHGLGVWLYDEDPYPSGNAGGWITIEHPERQAHVIECFEAEAALKEGELFCFPTGHLLWVGLVSTSDGATVDLTALVGIVRRDWHILDPWDSRWYYPATPLYPCARSETYSPEFALKAPRVPEGMKLVGFVARPSGKESVWGALPDTLDPVVTDMFIAHTHERYYAELGDLFGKEITAIFTDEAKYFGQFPWTPGMFESFRDAFGYDLRPRLADLFSQDDSARAMLTRIHYREWCGRRFEEAWLTPVGRWCREHNLYLVGHISPEDDLVEQANCITNLFPLQKHFGLAGLDLIIPAVGDAEHGLINIGVVTGVSCAQQQKMPGVMSESLACSGLDFTAAQAAKILNWQTVMGLTTPVVHGAFSSVEGHRLIDAPPDFGPQSPRWPGMIENDRALRPVQEKLIGARQIAPVALLWPIRTFLSRNNAWQHEGGGLRGDFTDLLDACLAHQVGVQFLDEADLWEAVLDGDALTLGWASYTHILIPSCTLLHARTVDALKRLHDAGLCVRLTGRVPDRQHTGPAIAPLDLGWCPRGSVDDAVTGLPRLADIQGDARPDIRCTAWTKDGAPFRLLINIGSAPCTVRVDGEERHLEVGGIRVVE